MTNKQNFIFNLRRFAEVGGDQIFDVVYDRMGYRENRGERLLAAALAKYLDRPEIPSDTSGINWHKDLGMHLVDAFVEFRVGQKWQQLRLDYLAASGDEVPDLVNVHVGGLTRMLTASKMAYLCAVMAGEPWVRDDLDGLFEAQQRTIDQAWRRFVRVGYRELMPRIKSEDHRGNKGIFGMTELLTYEMAGRVMFTFQCKGDLSGLGSGSVTYVADASDMYGGRSGSNATSTPFMTCIEMINEVCDLWSLDKMARADEVGFG